MLAIVNSRPETLGLKNILSHFLEFQYTNNTTKYNILLAKELEKKDLLVLGGGTGKAIFDMKNNQFIYFDTDILINYKIKIKKEELERIHKEKSIITQQKIK